MITNTQNKLLALVLASLWVWSSVSIAEPIPAKSETDGPLPKVEASSTKVRSDLVKRVVDEITVARLRRELVDARVRSLQARQIPANRASRVMFPPH